MFCGKVGDVRGLECDFPKFSPELGCLIWRAKEKENPLRQNLGVHFGRFNIYTMTDFLAYLDVRK